VEEEARLVGLGAAPFMDGITGLAGFFWRDAAKRALTDEVRAGCRQS
jgi:hypothetical protein